MCFVWIWEQTAIISLHKINWLVFIIETECVYCAVRTEYLNVIWVICFISITEQTAIISLHDINWLVFITETECVYCAVRTGCLHVIQDNFRLKGRPMPHAGSRRPPPTAEARVRSQISLYEICGEQSGTRTGFSPDTSRFPCQYHSTNAPHSSAVFYLLLSIGK